MNKKSSKKSKKKDDTLLWLIGLGLAATILMQKAKSQPEPTQTIDIIVND